VTPGDPLSHGASRRILRLMTHGCLSLPNTALPCAMCERVRVRVCVCVCVCVRARAPCFRLMWWAKGRGHR